MFWGLTIEPGKHYTQTVEESFHVSMAALETRDHVAESGGEKTGVVQVIIKHEKTEFLICSLFYGTVFQQPLDLNFTEGEEVTFFTEGRGLVHLTGYLVKEEPLDIDQDMMSLEDASSSDEVSVSSEDDDADISLQQLAQADLDDDDSEEEDDWSPSVARQGGVGYPPGKKVIKKKTPKKGAEEEESPQKESPSKRKRDGSGDADWVMMYQPPVRKSAKKARKTMAIALAAKQDCAEESNEEGEDGKPEKINKGMMEGIIVADDDEEDEEEDADYVPGKKTLKKKQTKKPEKMEGIIIVDDDKEDDGKKQLKKKQTKNPKKINKDQMEGIIVADDDDEEEDDDKDEDYVPSKKQLKKKQTKKPKKINKEGIDDDDVEEDDDEDEEYVPDKKLLKKTKKQSESESSDSEDERKQKRKEEREQPEEFEDESETDDSEDDEDFDLGDEEEDDDDEEEWDDAQEFVPNGKATTGKHKEKQGNKQEKKDKNTESLSSDKEKLTEKTPSKKEQQKKKKRDKAGADQGVEGILSDKENVSTPRNGKEKETNQEKESAKKEQKKKLIRQTLKGGVKIQDTQEGQGTVARQGKMVHVYYKGRLQSNNKQFDACMSGKPFSFRLGKGEVIPGWDTGVAGMKVGGKRQIIVPASQGYGNQRTGPIPPNSTLIFEVELKNVK